MEFLIKQGISLGLEESKIEQLWACLNMQDNYRLWNFSLVRLMERPLRDLKEQIDGPKGVPQGRYYRVSISCRPNRRSSSWLVSHDDAGYFCPKQNLEDVKTLLETGISGKAVGGTTVSPSTLPVCTATLRLRRRCWNKKRI